MLTLIQCIREANILLQVPMAAPVVVKKLTKELKHHL
jgi:hypothetical protein